MPDRTIAQNSKSPERTMPPPGKRIARRENTCSPDEPLITPPKSDPWDGRRNDARPCFRETFCRRFDIHSERFEIEVMRRCLPRRARLLALFIRPFSPHLFTVDELFVQCIGRVRDASELKAEIKAFRDHSANREWLRRSLKLRLSIWRLMHLADEVLPHLAGKH